MFAGHLRTRERNASVGKILGWVFNTLGSRLPITLRKLMKARFTTSCLCPLNVRFLTDSLNFFISSWELNTAVMDGFRDLSKQITEHVVC